MINTQNTTLTKCDFVGISSYGQMRSDTVQAMDKRHNLPLRKKLI